MGSHQRLQPGMVIRGQRDRACKRHGHSHCRYDERRRHLTGTSPSCYPLLSSQSTGTGFTKWTSSHSMLYSRHSHAGGMPMELTDSLKTLLIETAKSLKGSARRLFMARTVKELGPGGQQRAARELGGGRMTMRKGMRELATGEICIDAFALRG